ncbi:N-acetylaspartylglutamate synthase A [Galemys pyrenaicus]|uniref:N-acetylaspartylglutamate synthase n=1 Tax=Galemys pyrenaicus TaxID=202257 RepID=A0A8J6AA47_GALPY|nr:N-acetylaspartylglutamate synthase A [Galemys pyrenaicus]
MAGGAGGGAEWPGRFAGSGLQRRLAHRRERSRGARSPGTPAAASQPERASRCVEGASAAPGAAAAQAAMCSQLWFLTDRRIREDYPQVQILRALRQRCSEQDVRFRAVLMDQIAVTVVGGHLGLQLNQKALTTFPDVVLVRVPTPSVQSDSDITVLRHLEKLGCRLVNRPQSILNCINKFWTFQELAGHGVPMPDTFSYGGHEDFSKMIDEAEPLGYPVVVKSTRGHRGKAVFLARDKHHLSDICHLIRHDVPYLFQKYVKESHGKDIRVVVVGGQVIGSMLRCSTDGRMQSNCSLGGVGVMCPLTEQGKQLAVQVSNILGMDFCGIDLLITDDGSFVVCEANANVGFLAFDQACNLDVGGIIADYTMSLLPSRQTGKMALLPGLSTPREKKEPDGCASAQGVAESVYAINSGSTSSESELELGEIQDSSAGTRGAPSPTLPEPGYNINNRIASELKLK